MNSVVSLKSSLRHLALTASTLALAALLAPRARADVRYTITDLGTLGGAESYAYAINNRGQVVGYAYTAGNEEEHAFFYSGGVMTDLGTLGGDYNFSYAYGINDSGQVVGTAGFAFIYSDGAMKNLNTLVDPGSGWNLLQATAINDNGQIVGNGYNPSGWYRAFLLTPIPEPGTLSLIALGAAAAALLQGRRLGVKSA